MDKSATFWMLEPLRKYVTFSGRARRAEYWWFYLFYLGLAIAANIIDRLTGLLVATGLLSLALLLPMLAVGVRRLHDINHSGWWLLAPMLAVIPAFAGMFVGGAALLAPGGWGASPPMLAIALIGIGGLLGFALVILVFVWFCSRGTVGPNQFGADPLDPAGDVVGVFS